MKIKTERLYLRQFVLTDAGYIMKQLNDELFIRYIADKGVSTISEAEHYLRSGPIESYRTNGFGLYLVVRECDNESIGMCGLVKRPELEHPDLGFALLPEYRGRGYSIEAGKAVLKHEIEVHGIAKVLAVAKPDNIASNRVLEKCGFRLAGNAKVNDSKNNLYELASSQTTVSA